MVALLFARNAGRPIPRHWARPHWKSWSNAVARGIVAVGAIGAARSRCPP